MLRLATIARTRFNSFARRASLGAALWLGGSLALTSSAHAGPKDAPLEYRIELPDPASRYVEVSVQVPALAGKAAEFAMPAWAPGSYLVRDFGRHVYEVRAESKGKALKVTRIDKQSWRVAHQGKAFRLSYRVYADELSVRTSYVDDRMGLLNGTSVFMYLKGDTARPAALQVGARPPGWKVFTALEAGAPGRYRAASYDALVDAPLLMGEAKRETFKVAGAQFEYVLVAPGGTNADIKRLAQDTQKVVQAFADIMGGLPFKHYSFLLVADPAGGGGLEHTHSTAMILPPFSFGNDAGYERAARLAAHEFFHAWNVKRIHDRTLGPFDYSQENYTELLWFHEGFTETMEGRAVLRAGIIDNAGYLGGLAKSWTAYVNRPGSDYEPIAQLSRDAWIKAYKPASNHRNTSVSYYLKGDLIGVLLDLEIRKRARAHNREGSVEGMFRRMWAGRKAGSDELPIDMADIIDAASAEAGEDMSDFFARYVRGTQALPLPAALEAFGVEGFGLRAGELPPPPPSVGAALTPTTAPTPVAPPPPPKAWAGVHGNDRGISSIDRDSPAQRAGLAVGDLPIAVDGAQVSDFDSFQARIEGAKPGQRLRVDFFRRGRLDRRVVTVTEDPTRQWSFRALPIEVIDAEHSALQRAWLPPEAP